MTRTRRLICKNVSECLFLFIYVLKKKPDKNFISMFLIRFCFRQKKPQTIALYVYTVEGKKLSILLAHISTL